MRKKYSLKLSALIAIILPLSFLIQTTGLQKASAVDYKHVSENQQAGENQTDRKPSQNEVIAISNEFEDLLVQKADNNFKVINYRTKKDLLDSFAEIASRDVAAKYVDFYFNEKQDGLYVVPTELPPWLNEENNYDMIQLEKNKVKVVQTNKSNFYGDYTVAIEFTFDSKWKITSIVYY
ncbi:hypothetical protein [Virgibacillus oceani]|uniref:DUF3993 domain-containing protein n=1 Tax=Virgibacillus oceani TaxID=1479511 RepID=A0A917LYV1_9BACI|nr:hypothetical protein [Virgibacillus oceani]GGG66112.1 hypothetical protein GCM10011398_07150 [Virgibacillus oceani]